MFRFHYWWLVTLRSLFKSVLTYTWTSDQQWIHITHNNNMADMIFTVRGNVPQLRWDICCGVNGIFPYMLSQNRARVLGFSWLRRCLNQRWMVRTSQSSCLDRPSSLFSSGCWRVKTDMLDEAFTGAQQNINKNKQRTCSTLVIAVKTFSRIALGCAFCGPLVWIFRPIAHGLAINLQMNKTL